jgi:general secretion pathway protein E
MIGEIRDGASAQSALRAAMTGHQVWSTVHANSAVAIIDRLVDLGLPLAMTADHTIITGLISQRLVKLLCPHCRRRLATCENELSIEQTERLHKAVDNNLARVYLTGNGCKACGGKGTIGRTVVAEVILPDADLCTFLRNADKVGATAYWRAMLGGQTLIEHAISKIADGLIDPRMAEQTVGHLIPLDQRTKSATSTKRA